MTEDEILLRVEGLKTYFHTYEGTVKALEEINIEVKRGETLGLVGETGCGKTVTALSVMRLIPSPPGKIEAGRIFFNEPSSVMSLRNEYDKKFGSTLSEPRKKEIDRVKRELESLNAKDEIKKKGMKDELSALMYSYDLLGKSQAELNAIRGNRISMIFQEPLTALNPAYTVGNQIGETIELHQLDDLINDILRQIELERSALDAKKKAKRVVRRSESQSIKDVVKNQKEAEKREVIVCSLCGTIARNDWRACTGCGAILKRKIPMLLPKLRLAIASSYYSRMKKNSANVWAYLVQFNSITRRLQRRIKLAKTIRAEQALKEVKIAEPQMAVRNYPHELSGGMRQRAMIAMMMACQPDLLIADEPTTALDVTVEAQILSLMKELQRIKGTSILLITHDLGIIAETCHRVAIMYAGWIVELATTEEIFANPIHPYTNALLRSIPKIGLKHLKDRKKPLYVIPGSVPNLLTPPPGCRFHPRCERALEKCKSEVPSLIEFMPGHFAACHNPIRADRGGSSL